MNVTAGLDFTECVRMIPVSLQGESGIFVHSTYLDDEAPIAGGREIQGFPWKLARPKFCHESRVLAGTLYFSNVAKLPVLNVRSGTNFVADVTLGVGDVVHDYLALGQEAPLQRLSLAPEPVQ